jgi:CheY-like chemotaxis protein
MTHRSLVVLVVDDNPINLELVKVVLEAAGHVVRQAGSGSGALAAVQQETPDLVLTDIGLPGMDGYALLKALRNGPAAPIPVVALTAYAMEGDEQRAVEAGFDGYFTKPINTRTFAGEVLEVIEAKEARS